MQKADYTLCLLIGPFDNSTHSITATLVEDPTRCITLQAKDKMTMFPVLEPPRLSVRTISQVYRTN